MKLEQTAIGLGAVGVGYLILTRLTGGGGGDERAGISQGEPIEGGDQRLLNAAQQLDQQSQNAEETSQQPQDSGRDVIVFQPNMRRNTPQSADTSDETADETATDDNTRSGISQSEPTEGELTTGSPGGSTPPVVGGPGRSDDDDTVSAVSGTELSTGFKSNPSGGGL